MIQTFIFRPLLVLFPFLALFMGCSSHSPSPAYYLLNPLERTAVAHEAPHDGSPLHLGVGPVVLPEYLKRPQIVFRQENNQLALADYDRWAEPLAENVTRVLAENLALLVDTDYVYLYPYKSKIRIDYHILIDIYRFNAAPGPTVELIANWTVRSGKDRSLVRKKTFAAQKNLTTGEVPETVSALNAILSDFSREIASAIQPAIRSAAPRPSPHGTGMKQAAPSGADSAQAFTGEAAILQSWQGDFPVKQLHVLPEEQQDQALGFIVDAETFESVWAVFKAGESVPDIDFQANLVLFSRNTQFYNRTAIARVNLNDGVAEVLSMETMSALPIEDKVAFSMAVIHRKGVKGIKVGNGVIRIPEF